MRKKSMVISIMCMMMLGGLLSGCIEEQETGIAGISTKEFDVFATDAPNGRYWIQTNTNTYHSLFVYFSSTSSSLQQSYTIQFMNDDIVETVIVSSRDDRLNVHLTEDNTSMRFVVGLTDYDGPIYRGGPYSFANSADDAERDMLLYINDRTDSYYNLFNGVPHRLTDNGFLYTFDLYIPRPEICISSNTTIE